MDTSSSGMILRFKGSPNPEGKPKAGMLAEVLAKDGHLVTLKWLPIDTRKYNTKPEDGVYLIEHFDIYEGEIYGN